MSPYCSVISGQSGVVICWCGFNYKAGKIKLSNKRPLLSSLTSKNCSRRRWRRRRGVHRHRPWINDTAGEEMRGRTQAAETQHMTQSWNQEDLAASSHKAPRFHAFVFHPSAVEQLIDIFSLWNYCDYEDRRHHHPECCQASYPSITRPLPSDQRRKQKSFWPGHRQVGENPRL